MLVVLERHWFSIFQMKKQMEREMKNLCSKLKVMFMGLLGHGLFIVSPVLCPWYGVGMARLPHVMEEHILRCVINVLSVIVHKRRRSQSGEESRKVSGRLEKFVMSPIFHFSSLKLLKMVYIYEFPKLKKYPLVLFVLFWILKRKLPNIVQCNWKCVFYFCCNKSWMGNGNLYTPWQLRKLNENAHDSVTFKVSFIY